MPASTNRPSFLATPRGRLTLLFLCLVGFLDFADGSIVNVALPSIQHGLHVSIQNLQWVLSGYALTYGGFLLLGGRMSDLLGRRRFLLAGTILFAVSSLLSGLAGDAGLLIVGRLLQGLGAAMMTPAALSILTTSFNRARTASRPRRVGCRRRSRVGAGGLPRWRTHRRPRLAVGVLRQPTGLRDHRHRRIPAPAR